MNLARLKWLGLIAPFVFLVLVVFLIRGPFHEDLHRFPGILFLILGLAVGVSAFTFVIFGLIGRIERQIIEQNSQLSALLAVGRAASSSLDLSEVLDEALDAVLEVTSAEVGEIWLATVDGALQLERLRGPQAELFRERTRFELGEGLPGVTAQTDSPLVVRDLATEPRFCRRAVTEAGFQTFCGQSLRHRDDVLGVLAVFARDPDALSSPAELRLLEGIGEQVAVAIANARLHERVLQGAVLEERVRIARELHDGLAQVLGYINTQTLAIRKLLASGKTADAQLELSAMESAAREVYTDVREAILGLRSSLDAPGGLVAGLRHYLEEYEATAGFALELEEDLDGVVRLPPSAEIQVMRIVQEALSNVRKHARAARATVALRTADSGLTVEVQDDGQGFDPDHPGRTGWPRFGLQTMRERAEAIGGTFSLRSAPGSGTRVTVEVPTEEVARASAARG